MTKSYNLWWLLVFAVVLLHSLWPYWLSHLAHPEASLSFLVMHRWSGDASYLPLLRFVADGNISENVIRDPESARGLLVFQMFSILPGAILFKLFGAAGIVLTDLIFQCLLLVSYVVVLRLALRSMGLRILLALVFKLGALSAMAEFGFHLPSLAFRGWDTLGFRFPNPLISACTLFFAIPLVWKAFVGRRSKAFVLLSYVMVLLAQQNAYYTLHIAATSALLMLWRWDTRRWLTHAKKLLPHVPFLLILGSPFIVQMVKGSLEMKERLGLFPIQAVTGILTSGKELLPGVLMETFSVRFSKVALLCLAYVWLKRSAPFQKKVWNRIFFLLALVAGAYLNQPLLCAVMKMNTHPYHFSEHRSHTEQIVMLLLLLPLLTYLPRSWLASRMVAYLAAGMIVIAGGLYSHQAFQAKGTRLQYWGYENDTYDQSFAELINHFEKNGHTQGDATLVTADLHALHYWTLYGPKHCFAPEPWASTVKSKEIEHRVYAMWKLFGVTEEGQANALLDDSFWLYFISCNRYHASPAYHMEEPRKYSTKDRELLYNGKWWKSWQLAIPTNERKRMLKTFHATQAPTTLGNHLILMVKGHKMETLKRPNGYTTEFENKNFVLLRAETKS